MLIWYRLIYLYKIYMRNFNDYSALGKEQLFNLSGFKPNTSLICLWFTKTKNIDRESEEWSSQ